MQKRENPILVTHPYMPNIEMVMKYASNIWESRWLTNNGPLVRELEEKLQDTLKVENAIVFANGHLALDSAIRSYEFKQGSEIITTPFTYVSTTQAIEMNGLKPVFCDIKESDCTIDENLIESLVTEKTCAIIGVHVYGFPCNCEAIENIAKKYNLKVIYDSAHAFGVEINDEGIGTFGDISMFSMHATKVYHTVEGGLLTFNDKINRERLMLQKSFGLENKENAIFPALNAKMSEMHAAVGLANLESFDRQVARRKEIVNKYNMLISELNGEDKNSKIRLFDFTDKTLKYNYAYYPIIIKKDKLGISRDELEERLWHDWNVNARKYFAPLISDMTYYRNKYGKQEFPIAKQISDAVLTLPIYYEMSDEDVEYVVNAIKEIIK